MYVCMYVRSAYVCMHARALLKLHSKLSTEVYGLLFFHFAPSERAHSNKCGSLLYNRLDALDLYPSVGLPSPFFFFFLSPQRQVLGCVLARTIVCNFHFVQIHCCTVILPNNATGPVVYLARNILPVA